jgi:hypothetical protein
MTDLFFHTVDLAYMIMVRQKENAHIMQVGENALKAISETEFNRRKDDATPVMSIAEDENIFSVVDRARETFSRKQPL